MQSQEVSNTVRFQQLKASYQLTVIQDILPVSTGADTDEVSLSLGDTTKGISVTAQEILEKLNALLKDKLPDGIQSLKPEDTTPEATASRIVQGVTALYGAFSKQNPTLSGEELLNKFMDTVKGGVQAGYDDAVGTLEDLGAFSFEGVKSGIEETKRLIDEKLAAFEQAKRKDLGLSSSVDSTAIADLVSPELTAQAGTRVAQPLNLRA